MSEHDTSPPSDDDWPLRKWRRLDHLAEQVLDLPVDLDTPPADELALLTWRALRASRHAADPLAAYLRALPHSEYWSVREVEAAVRRLEEADEGERARIRQELIIYHLPMVARRAWSHRDGTVPPTELLRSGNQAIVDLVERLPSVPPSTVRFSLQATAAIWRAMLRLETASDAAGSEPGNGGSGPGSAGGQ
jgi:DNA-directed RNA polymerase sigma subunit (sigma70/sigma32)